MMGRVLGAAGLALMLAGCQTDKAAVMAVDAAKRAPLDQVAATSCGDRSVACSQLHAQHGARCLNGTEARDPAERARNRACALSDFRAALDLATADPERLVGARGLAEALRIDRDNTPDAATRDADRTELDRVAAQLTGLPGGGAYGGYYAADNGLNRVLQRVVGAAQACGTLAQAGGALAGAAGDQGDADLRRRRGDLQALIAMAKRQRSCG